MSERGRVQDSSFGNRAPNSAPITRVLEICNKKGLHARASAKFVQTVEVAATAKELLEAQKHISLRQAFYKMRRTIPGTSIDIVDDQTESNSAVEDL